MDTEAVTNQHCAVLPIDVVISPEIEVAKSIANRLRVPGAFNIIPMADGRVQVVSVICKEDCPLINAPLKHLTPMFPDLTIEIIAIIRGEEKIIPREQNAEDYKGADARGH